MSLTVSNLFKFSQQFHLKLIAGENGLNNLIHWVHIIEINEGARFLHGQELVITAGILGTKEEQLLSFMEHLFSLNASAVIINIGKFIKEVPASVINFCNQNNLPLFTIPWEVPLVDVTREVCQKIMEHEARENSVASVIKNLIFHTGDQESDVGQMERFGFMLTSNVKFLCIALEEEKGTEDFAKHNRILKMNAERCAKSIKEQFASFEYQEKRIVFLVDYTEEDVKNYIEQFLDKMSVYQNKLSVFIGVGDTVGGLENLDAAFMSAFYACEIAVKKEDRIVDYRDLGIYKLLVNVPDRKILKEFYDDVFGRLIIYDKENNTEYHQFLKTYIKFNGHQGNVSESCFIHRNTVNNYIKKIEEIIGIDVSTWEGKAKLFMAYCIENIL